MAKRKRKKKQDSELLPGEQLNLIDVAPENAKEILKVAKIYEAAKKERLKALAEEVKQKQKVLELIHEAKLQRMEDGKINVKCDRYTIVVTPTDEKIKIKIEGDEDED